ncbi:hypothetical protein AN695_0205825 [Serratia marcescens]|uniref:Uncharacterized protein n=1 Tax=Serratia marcescens TaxID=615 RepID=A0A6H2ZS65_SERMA|nr:hypothetical protein AN695_0205825 [Serratia marcescens]
MTHFNILKSPASNGGEDYTQQLMNRYHVDFYRAGWLFRRDEVHLNPKRDALKTTDNSFNRANFAMLVANILAIMGDSERALILVLVFRECDISSDFTI